MEDDYEVIPLRVSWAGLSVFLFLLTLPVRYLLQFLPWRPQRMWLWPLVPPMVIFGLALAGLLAGWIGYYVSASRGVAKTGMFLNGVVLAIVLSIALVWLYIASGR